MKYNNGDRVRIVNYGHPIWEYNKAGDKYSILDLRPGLVGKEATIVNSKVTQGKEQYKLAIDDYGEISWFGLKQLEDA